MFATSIVQSLFFCDCTVRFVSDVVGNPEDRFSQNEAHSVAVLSRFCGIIQCSGIVVIKNYCKSVLCDNVLFFCGIIQCSGIVVIKNYCKSVLCDNVLFFCGIIQCSGIVVIKNYCKSVLCDNVLFFCGIIQCSGIVVIKNNCESVLCDILTRRYHFSH